MIKFFRHIRYNLMEIGKTGKYFKYAIGEIVLVVIGILIAVQINNWNIERNNSIQEGQILKQLQEEFIANLVEVNSKIAMRNDMIETSEKIMYYFDNSVQGVAMDTLSSHLQIIGLTPTTNPSTGVTNELINSGKLYLIKNQELKKLLTNWSGDIKKLQEMETTLLDFVKTELNPYVLNNYQFRRLVNVSPDIESKFMIGEAKAPDFNSTFSESEFEKLYSDQYFENIAVNVGLFAYYGNRQSAGIRKRIDAILNIIEGELIKKQ